MAVSNLTINHNAPNTQIIIQTEQHFIITGDMCSSTVITDYQLLSKTFSPLMFCMFVFLCLFPGL